MQQTNKPFLAMLTLLQAGLWERRPKDCSLFPLTPAEWTAGFVLAQQQTVLGITYRGLDYLPEYLFPPQELLIRWVAEIGRIEERNLESNQSLIELLELFEGEGLFPILQKGQGVATLYDRCATWPAPTTPSIRASMARRFANSINVPAWSAGATYCIASWSPTLD